MRAARAFISPTPEGRRVFQVAVALGAASLLGNGLALYFSWPIALTPIEIIVRGSWIGFTLLCGVAGWLSRTGRARLGAWVLFGAGLVNVPLSALWVAGLGLIVGGGLILFAPLVGIGLGLSGNGLRRLTILSVAAGVITFVVDTYGPANRFAPSPTFQTTALALIGGLLVIYVYLVVRDFRTFTFRNKLLVAFLSVTLSALGILAFFSIQNTRNVLLAAADSSLHAGAIQTANRFDDFIGNNLDAINTAAQFPALTELLALPAAERAGSPAQINVLKFMFSLRKNRSGGASSGLSTYLQSYALLDKNGQVVLDTETQNLGESFADRLYFTQPLATDQPYVSPVLFEPRAGARVYFAAPVAGSVSEVAGVMIARYSAGVIQQIVLESNELLGEHSHAILVDEHDIILADGENPVARFKTVMPLAPEVLSNLQAEGRLPILPLAELSINAPELKAGLTQAATQATFIGELHPDSADEGIERAAVAQLKTQPWYAVFEKRQTTIIEAITPQTQQAIGLVIGLAGLVALLAVGLAQILTEPVVRLTATAQQIAAGNLNARAPITAQDEIGALALALNGMTAQLQQTLGQLENRVNERTAQLQAAAEIGRVTTSVRNLDELLQTALQLIRERFNIYHASIFLVEAAGAYAVLRESTGEVGAQLKARGHKLAIGSQSLVGWVTQHRRPRVAGETVEDPYHFKNPLLPNTRSEACIPLIIGQRLLGALDVQSTQPNAFPDSNLQVLQTLADLLSVAIENAELFQTTQSNLQEMQRRYQQVAGGGLRSLLQEHPSEIVYNLEPEVAGTAVTPAGPPLLIPLRVRDEVIGTLELHGALTTFAVEEQAIIDTIAAQLAVALESATLFEEAQRRSRREQMINQIADQMRASLNPATIMQNGIRELGKALGATEVVVHFQPTFTPETAGPPEAP